MAVPFECKGMRDYLIRNTCAEIESEVGDLSKLSSPNEQIELKVETPMNDSRNRSKFHLVADPEWVDLGRWFLEASARHVLPQLLRA